MPPKLLGPAGLRKDESAPVFRDMTGPDQRSKPAIALTTRRTETSLKTTMPSPDPRIVAQDRD